MSDRRNIHGAETKTQIVGGSTENPPALIGIAMANCARRRLVAASKTARHLTDVRHCFLARRIGSAAMYKICTCPPQVRRH
jgi:hypothetical protein